QQSRSKNPSIIFLADSRGSPLKWLAPDDPTGHQLVGRYPRPHGLYIARSALPRRKIMRGVKPPRSGIQVCTGSGYIEYSCWVASRSVIVRPLLARSYAAWKPSVARGVTQMFFVRHRA